MGDVILLRRAIAGLRAAGHSVCLLAPSEAAAALRGPGELDTLLPWEAADAASLFSGEPSTSMAAHLQGIDVAVAYTRSDDLTASLTRLVRHVLRHDPQPPAGRHASGWLAEPLAALGIPVPAAVPPLVPTEAERDEARRRLGWEPGYLVIHPGSGSASKNWPADRFAQLADAVSPNRPWLLALGPAEAASAMGAGGPRVFIAHEWPVRVLLAALAEAGLYVGNDSGITHLAAAAGTRTVALFGPTDPTHWAPAGDRVTVVRSPDGTMEGLDVDRVLAAGPR